MGDKYIFMNAEGAFKAIEEAVKYLGDNGYVEGFMALNATEKSDVTGMVQLFAGTELDVASCLMLAAVKCKNIRDVIKKTGRVIAEKWDEYETVLNDTICDADAEEVADE